MSPRLTLRECRPLWPSTAGLEVSSVYHALGEVILAHDCSCNLGGISPSILLRASSGTKILLVRSAILQLHSSSAPEVP